MLSQCVLQCIVGTWVTWYIEISRTVISITYIFLAESFFGMSLAHIHVSMSLTGVEQLIIIIIISWKHKRSISLMLIGFTVTQAVVS